MCANVFAFLCFDCLSFVCTNNFLGVYKLKLIGLYPKFTLLYSCFSSCTQQSCMLHVHSRKMEFSNFFPSFYCIFEYKARLTRKVRKQFLCGANNATRVFEVFSKKKEKKNKTKQKYSKKKRRRKSLSEKNSIYQLRGIYSTRKFHSCVLESLPSPTSVSLYTPCPQEKKNNLKTDFGSTLSPRRQGMNSGIRIKSSNKKLFTD